MKYTLYCVPGVMGRTGKHYLYLGGWIRPAHTIILTHGVMSYCEYEEIQRNGYAVVYSHPGLNWIGIYQSGFCGYHKTRVGCLRKESVNLYSGHVRLLI